MIETKREERKRPNHKWEKHTFRGFSLQSWISFKDDLRTSCAWEGRGSGLKKNEERGKMNNTNTHEFRRE